jgi:prevent-host-death family protein
MNIPTRNFIGITELGNETARVVNGVVAGQNYLVMRNNKPVAAVVSPELMDRLQELDEQEEDLRLLCLTVARVITDNGTRHNLRDVIAELGIDLDDEE